MFVCKRRKQRKSDSASSPSLISHDVRLLWVVARDGAVVRGEPQRPWRHPFSATPPHLHPPSTPLFSPSFATVTPPFFSGGHFPIKKSIWRFPKKATRTSTEEGGQQQRGTCHHPIWFVLHYLIKHTYIVIHSENVFLIQAFKVVSYQYVEPCNRYSRWFILYVECRKAKGGYEVKVYVQTLFIKTRLHCMMWTLERVVMRQLFQKL